MKKNEKSLGVLPGPKALYTKLMEFFGENFQLLTSGPKFSKRIPGVSPGISHQAPKICI